MSQTKRSYGHNARLHVVMVLGAFIITSLAEVAHAAPWSGSSSVATTPLGHQVAVSCHNCYNGPNNEVYSLVHANSKIERALDRGADLIELDVGDAGNDQDICVSHSAKDENPCGANEPRLRDILANEELELADSAMLFIELKGIKSSASDFAERFLEELLAVQDAAGPIYARPGRPLFVRAFTSRIGYLQAIQNKLQDSRFAKLRGNVRFSVLFSGRDWGKLGSIATLQTEIRTKVADNDFDFVEFDYRLKDLLGATRYAQSLGLGVGVFTVPASFGELYVAALREEVDQITTEYRVDYARVAVQDANLLAYVNAGACGTIKNRSNFGSGQSSVNLTLGRAPTSSLYGTPRLMSDLVGEDRFGCSLDYRKNQGQQQRALHLGDRDNLAADGYLVTAFVNFNDLSTLPEGSMAIVNKSEAGGFALELKRSGGKVVLRFGVHVDGGYRYHEYNVSQTGLGGDNQELNGRDGYFLVGAYDGNGGVYLFVDNARVSSGGSSYEGVKRNNAGILIGADPQGSGASEARFFFDGLIQQVSVQRWSDHNSGTN